MLFGLSETYSKLGCRIEELVSVGTLVDSRLKQNQRTLPKKKGLLELLNLHSFTRTCKSHHMTSETIVILNLCITFVHDVGYNQKHFWLLADVLREVTESALCLRITIVNQFSKPVRLHNSVEDTHKLKIMDFAYQNLSFACKSPGMIGSETNLEQICLDQESFLQPLRFVLCFLTQFMGKGLSLEVAQHFHAMFCDHSENRLNGSSCLRHHDLLLISWLLRKAIESSRDLTSIILMGPSILLVSIETYVSFGTFLIRLGGLCAPKLLKPVLVKRRLFSGNKTISSSSAATIMAAN